MVEPQEKAYGKGRVAFFFVVTPANRWDLIIEGTFF